MYIILRLAYDMFSLWCPRPHFQRHSLISGISFETVDRFSPKLHGYIVTSLSIGVGRFRILGGPRFRILGGAKGGQIPSRHMTS